MTEITNSRLTYDLEERMFQFAKAVRLFVKKEAKDLKQIFSAIIDKSK